MIPAVESRHGVTRLPQAVFGAAITIGVIASIQGLMEARLMQRPPSIRPLLAALPHWLLWACLAYGWFVFWSRISLAGLTRAQRIAVRACEVLVLMLLHSALLYAWQRAAGLTDIDVPLWKGAIGVGYSRLVPNLLVYGLMLSFLQSRAAPVFTPPPETAVVKALSPGANTHVTTIQSPIRQLVLKQQGRVILVSADAVDWIEAADYYARVHAEGRAILIRETMASLAARLDPEKFCRVHRSAIVNVARVKELRCVAKGEHVAILHDGRRIRVNRTRRKRLERLLRGGR
jgi:hypothetical protein